MEDRVLRTTTKYFAVGVGLSTFLLPVCAWASVQAALPLLLSAASLGADTRSAVAQADDLLREARQAIADGNYEIADSKISRAEALQPKYPLFHMGDSPQKARAYLEKVLAQKAAADRKGKTAAKGSPQDPFLAHA